MAKTTSTSKKTAASKPSTTKSQTKPQPVATIIPPNADPKHSLQAIKARIGRPSKYDPAYCAEVIQAGTRGFSLTAFAGMILVARDTLSEWMNVHPDFSAAIKIHAAARTAFLEGRLIGAASSPVVISSIFALKNAAPGEWREKQEVNMNVNLTLADMVAESYKLEPKTVSEK